jgi:ABC-type multidrug transport system fused ATPase/permease subunit
MVYNVLDRVPLVRDVEKCIETFEVRKSIRYEDVTFKYPKQPEKTRNVFDKINLEIRAEETTAIVGPSGSGKSTLIQMIERFYDPKEGNIFFD